MTLTPEEVRGCERIAAILRETAPERRAEMLQRAIELSRMPRGSTPPASRTDLVTDAETKPLKGRVAPPAAAASRDQSVTTKLQVHAADKKRP